MRKIHNIPKCFPKSFGNLPTSYSLSLSYEEQLFDIGRKINEIIDFINDILEQKLNEYIVQIFNDVIIDSMYNAETETLVLYLDNSGGGE